MLILCNTDFSFDDNLVKMQLPMLEIIISGALSIHVSFLNDTNVRIKVVYLVANESLFYCSKRYP